MNLFSKEHRGCLAVASIVLMAFLLLFYGYVWMYPHPEIIILDFSYNTIMYAVSIVMVFILFPLLVRLMIRLRRAEPLGAVANRILSLGAAVYGILALAFLYVLYDNESTMPTAYPYEEMLMREYYPHGMFTVVMMIFVLLSVLFLQRRAEIGRVYRIGLAFVAAVAGAILDYGPNPMRNAPLGAWHNNAYTNTIIQVAQGVPYRDSTSTIYGHYGLIYLPFVKLFGDNYRAVAITMSLFTAVIFLCAAYTASKLIRNDMIYTLVLVAAVGTFMTYIKQCQTISCLPHRVLFPMIVCAYIAWERSRDKALPLWQTRLLDTVLGLLAFVFNTETGLILMLVIAFYRILAERRPESGFKGLFLSWLRQCVYIASCIVMAYIWVQVYNLLCGCYERLGVHTFFYPMLSDGYQITVENYLPMSSPLTPYILPIFLFMFLSLTSMVWLWFYADHARDAAACAIDETGAWAPAPGKGVLDDHGRVSVLFVVSLSALGAFSYFMDRPSFGQMNITHIAFIILIGYWVDRYLGNGLHRDTWRKAGAGLRFHLGMAGCAFVLLSWFSWECVFTAGQTIERRTETLWDTASWEQSLATLQEELPEGIMCFGLGMPEICYDAGIDPGIHLQDFANWNGSGETALMQALSEVDTFAVTTETYFDHSAFELVRKIETNDFTIDIYERP